MLYFCIYLLFIQYTCSTYFFCVFFLAPNRPQRYANYILFWGVILHPKNGVPGYDSKLYPLMKLMFWKVWSNPFITITPIRPMNQKDLFENSYWNL